VIIFILIVLFTICKPVLSQDIVAGQSAQLDNIIFDSENIILKDKQYDYLLVKLSIKSVLEKYHSPLISETESFTNSCKKYNLNCFLLPSIAGLESTFGKFLIDGSYNPFGWGGGRIYFNSWSDGIDTVAKGLKENYIDKGATNLYDIGSIYSESPTWTQRVGYFISEFEKVYADNQLYLLY